MNTQTIAILGLGAMGSRIATNIINAGYALIVWNRSPAPIQAPEYQGAMVAKNPRQAAERADIVISMVTDDAASTAVWLTPESGAVLGLKPGSVAIEFSTLTVGYVQALEQAIKAAGAHLLTAPVVGSLPQAEAQTLISLVGGDIDLFEQVRPVLSVSSGTLHHVGTASQGMAMKLAVNTLFGIQVAALAELLTALEQQGIAPEQAMDCLGNIPVTSPAAKGAGTLIVTQKHSPMFPIHLVEKDFRYACEMTENMPTTTALQQLYRQAITQGYGKDNITAISQLFL